MVAVRAAVAAVAFLVSALLLTTAPGGGPSTRAPSAPLLSPSVEPASLPLGPPTAVEVAPAFVPGPSAARIGSLPASQPLTVLVGLPSRDATGLAAAESAASVPGIPAYHHFLTAPQVSERFGAAPSVIASAESYFRSNGLSATPEGDGFYLAVAGPAANLGVAFGTSFSEFRAGDGRVFFSHTTAATLPAGIGWTGAYGLGNETPFVPTVARPGVSLLTGGPLTGCSSGDQWLAPCEIWNAYNMSGSLAGGINGTGETIGVVDSYDAAETQNQLARDLGSFDTAYSLPAPRVSYNYPVPTRAALNSTDTGWALEEALDIEWAHASAPGASIAMTFAPNSGVGLYEAVDWLVANQLVDVISLSWGEPDVGVYNSYHGPCSLACNATSDGSYEILGPVLAAAALEGISVVVATGDCGAADGTNGVATDYPSSDPSVTAVGGTSLLVSGSGGYLSETGWSGNASGRSAPGCNNQGGSGGGYSPFPRPWWQSGSGVPTSPASRGTPDVAMDASTPVNVYLGGGEEGVIGTSLSCPLWAGIAAEAAQASGQPLGLLDPALYEILQGPHYSRDFHDITTGNNGYAAGTGWDPVTGIGTPNVGSLLPDLALPAHLPSSLTATLGAGPRFGSAPLGVAFALAAAGGSGRYPLEGVYFGDNTSGLLVNGSADHVYDQTGVFTAVGFVADSSGNLSTAPPVEIVVGGGGPLSVTLRASTTTPAVGVSVGFTASVVGGTSPLAFDFAYGDGTFLNGTSSTVTAHAYGAAGGFCATVLVSDSGHPPRGGASRSVPILVGGAGAPTCPGGSAPLTVAANPAPMVRDAPADFPNLFTVAGGTPRVGSVGTTYTYSSSDPYVTACDCTILRAPGTYSVNLFASDPVGDQASNSTVVTVAPALSGSFRASTLGGDAPLVVGFTASVSGGYLANAADAVWQFGDGQSATGAVATHTYTAPGLYVATGSIADQGSGNASEAFVIDAVGRAATSPMLTGTISPAVNVASGSTVSFVANSTAPGGSPVLAEYVWSLGDNTTSFQPDTQRTYYAAGPAVRSLNLVLNATWPSNGSARTVAISLPEFWAVESAGFIPQVDAMTLDSNGGPSRGPAPLLWTGMATPLAPPGAVSASWAFGDGTQGVGLSTSHRYLDSGLFTVVLGVTDGWGDTAWNDSSVEVGPRVLTPLTLSGGPSTLAGHAPLRVTFTAAASGGAGPPYTYTWGTGDGLAVGGASFQHNYTVAGTYTASLAVTDILGEITQENWTIVVGSPLSTAAESTASIAVVSGAIVIGAAVGALVWVCRRPRRGRPASP